MSYSFSRPKIMGIVNATPDSFSDGGQFSSVAKTVEHALKLVRDGADMIDIGGESSRPGAYAVSCDEELSRVMPVIERLRKESSVYISIDTRKSEVMRIALEQGVQMINDISSLTYDDRSLDVVRRYNTDVCLMHMRGTPETMAQMSHYEDVVREVHDYLRSRIEHCVKAGIPRARIYCDPGIGFSKNATHNIELLRNIHLFTSLGVRVLIGTSRKTFIQTISGRDILPKNRLGGSLASIVTGLDAGVDVIRVHDVFQTKQFIDMYTRLKG